MSSKKKYLSNEAFVAAWQSADTLAAAAKSAGTSVRQASDRAHYLRKAGVRLKVFREPGQKIDRERLQEVVERLAKAIVAEVKRGDGR